MAEENGTGSSKSGNSDSKGSGGNRGRRGRGRRKRTDRGKADAKAGTPSRASAQGKESTPSKGAGRSGSSSKGSSAKGSRGEGSSSKRRSRRRGGSKAEGAASGNAKSGQSSQGRRSRGERDSTPAQALRDDDAAKRKRRRRKGRGKGPSEPTQDAKAKAPQKENLLDLGLDVKSFLNLSAGEGTRLAQVGIKSLFDILFTLPTSYQDRRKVFSSKTIRPGEGGTLIGNLSKRRIRLHRGGDAQERLAILEFTDSLGTFLAAYTLPEDHAHIRSLKIGQRFIVTGQVIEFKGDAVIVEPTLEAVDPKHPLVLQQGGIFPSYGSIEGIPDIDFSHYVYQVLVKAAGRILKALPYDDVPDLEEALWGVHFPTADSDLDALNKKATIHHDTLLESELFLYGQAVILRRIIREGNSTRLGIKHSFVARFIKALPYELTDDQALAFEEIKRDLLKTHPMGRLIQADTGTGKIAVGMMAALLAVENKYQSAFIVPTDLMAERRHRAMAPTLEKMGVKVALLSSSVRGKERETALQELRKGDANLLIGTREAFESDLQFRRLGLVVLEEAHFGGIQPNLPNKGRRLRPHLLVLTTIPIPTALAYLQFGDLDISKLTTRPTGYGKVETHVIHGKDRQEAFGIFAEILGDKSKGVLLHKRGLKEDALGKIVDDIVQGGIPREEIGILPDVALSEERDAVMARFRAREHRVLLIPLGEEELVDLKVASTVIVDGAEGCSLSYLNRLRVMAERGPDEGGAIFISSGPTADAEVKRLGLLAQEGNGFDLADADLRHRGLNAFVGGRISNLPRFKVVDISRHLPDLPDLFKDVEAWAASNIGWHNDPQYNHLTSLLRSRWGSVISGKTK